MEWLAQISTEHERELRRLRATEAESSQAHEQSRLIVADSNFQEANWDPAKHPRGAFPQNPGWWSPTGGSGSGGGRLAGQFAPTSTSGERNVVDRHSAPPQMIELATAWHKTHELLGQRRRDLETLPARIESERAQLALGGRAAPVHSQNLAKAEQDLKGAQEQVPQLEDQLRQLRHAYTSSGYDALDYAEWTPGETRVGGRGIEEVGRAVAASGSPAGLTPTGDEATIATAIGPARQLVRASLAKSIGKSSSATSKEIFIDSARFPQSAKHLEDAGALNRPLTINRSGASANRAAALRNKAKTAGMDLDEAPPAVFRQPGDPVSVRPIPASDNRGAGASMGNQLRGVPDGGSAIIKRKPKG